MRIIKFRAWDTKEKVMIYNGFTLEQIWEDGAKIDYAQNIRELSFPESANALKWMQYTGLKDKNGKEIYEGDIIIFDKQNIVDSSDCGTRVIEWLEDHGMFSWVDMVSRKTLSGWTFAKESARKYSIVIGNIYENKDLLN